MQFNSEVDEFINKTIPTRIQETFKPIGSVSLNDSGKILPGQISVADTTPFIQRYWLLNENFNINYENEYFRLNDATVAIIPPDLGNKLNTAIDKLKNDPKLSSAMNGNLTLGIKGFKQRKTELTEIANKLSKYINDAIIFKIERAEYHMDDL